MTAETRYHMFFLARHAFSWMTITLAFMIVAIQYLLTFFTALERLTLLAASHCSLWFSTLTGNNRSLEVTRFALAWVTEIRTRMRTKGSSFLITPFSTRMRLQIPLIFRIQMLPAEAIIFRHRLIVLELALRALPAINKMRFLIKLLIDINDPSLDAF